MNDRLLALLAAAGVPADRVASVGPLGGGTFNAVHLARLHDGTGLVIKVAPGPETTVMTHEPGILATEALVNRLAAEQGVRVPEVLHAEPDALVMRECPGTPWLDHERAGGWAAMRAELGRQVALLHRITGPGFGYPGGALGPLHDTWPAAFLGMVDAVLGDAGRFGVDLPRPTPEIRSLYAGQAGALAVVTTPVLVHFDLWDGNLLVDRTGGDARLTALIDSERAFWGDPAADFVSTALMRDLDGEFLGGYGLSGLDAATRWRVALYRGYLDLIMLVEAVPRQASKEHRRWLAQRVRPDLTAILDHLD